MGNNDWTLEQVQECEKKLNEAEMISETLNKFREAHFAGGICFQTTLQLLRLYRTFRFDVVSEKMLKTAEAVDPDAEHMNSAASLDTILAMPEIYGYYSKELRNFISSSTPALLGRLVHMIDTGIRILANQEDKSGIRYSELLKALYVDEIKTPNELLDMFHTNSTTFYRKKNEAITALSILIFGPLGSRHPNLRYEEDKFQNKYGRFLEVANYFDDYCELLDVHEQFN